MADNRIEYGFRYVRSANGGPMTVEEHIVATSQSFDVNGGAANVKLRPGDPVIKLAAGGVNLCDGNEGAGGALAPYGIVVGIQPYYDVGSTRMVFADGLPADVAWGTNLERQSKVLVVPVQTAIWEIDTDDTAAAYDTEAEIQAFAGENADCKLWGASGETSAKPRLDISTHAVTSTLVWRILGISPTLNNQDFTGNYVKMLVKANVVQGITVGLAGV
jgi:hypothetical protein